MLMLCITVIPTNIHKIVHLFNKTHSFKPNDDHPIKIIITILYQRAEFL
jgi:hypothetical protein